MAVQLVNGVFVSSGPVWKDCCNHGAGTYVATFETLGETYDLYVWEPADYLNSSVCIRFGNDDGEYAGIMSIIDLATGAQAGMEYYKDALAILRHYGTIQWKRS